MKRILLLAVLVGFICQKSFAQDFNKVKLDSFFTTLAKNNKFVGSVAISKEGKIIYTRSIGYADIKDNIKNDRNTKFRIGSISKTFTAVLVLKAVEQNKLELNQTINKYFPSISNSGEITINQLLHHRSGIHNFTADKDYLTWHTEHKSEKEMIGIIARGRSDFKPGSKFEYSNSNYVLLSFILEKVFNQPYSDLLQKYIVKPLGLKNTYLGGNINPENDEAYSYRFVGNWVIQPETNISIPLGAGGIVSTPIDLVKFSNALFNNRLLKPSSLELMKTLKDGYGMGLFGIPFYTMKGFGHTGGIDGFTSVFVHFSKGDVSYALTSNGTNYNNNNISIAVTSAVYNKPYEVPDFSTYQIGQEEMEQYVGVYSSKQIPLKITISIENKTLIAQGSGQPSFPLTAIAENKFKNGRAGVIIEFYPKENKMILKQGGGEVTFSKD